jgi:hypothetical protein
VYALQRHILRGDTPGGGGDTENRVVGVGVGGATLTKDGETGRIYTVPQVARVKSVIKYCAKDSTVNDELHYWHSQLQYGDASAQVEIDRRIFACLFVDHGTKSLGTVPLQSLYLKHNDTPQIGNLPDLLWVFRHRFTYGWFGSVIQENIFRYSIPCIRKSKQPPCTDKNKCIKTDIDDTVLYSVYINVLYGTLLGLYPHASKFPIFGIRKQLVFQIRALLIATPAEQERFIMSNINIMRICFMEYFVYMMENDASVEKQLVQRCLHYETYINLCQTTCDHFRQTTLQTDYLDWVLLDQAAFRITDKIIRTTRIGTKLYTYVGNVFALRKLSTVWDSALYSNDLFLRVVRESPMCCWHMEPSFLYDSIIRGMLQHDKTVSDQVINTLVQNTEIMHGLVHVRELPTNFAVKQTQVLLKRFESNNQLVYSVCNKTVCLYCVTMVKQNVVSNTLINNTRMCMETSTIICNKCTESKFLVNVNLLGKLLIVERNSFYICPYCIEVHVWSSTGSEIMQCQHGNNIVPVHKKQVVSVGSKRKVRPRQFCLLCRRQCNTVPLELVDVATFSMTTVSLCSKHCVPMYMTGYIQDTRQLLQYFDGVAMQGTKMRSKRSGVSVSR